MSTQARLKGNLTIFPNKKCTYACIRIVIAALFITAPTGHYPDGHQQKNEPACSTAKRINEFHLDATT